MSGECDDCGEHTLDCRCNMRQGDGIKIWIQLFFEDGSLGRPLRIPAEWLDEGYEQNIIRIIKTLLEDLNRDEGHVLIWGAGNIAFKHYPSAFYPSKASESDSLV